MYSKENNKNNKNLELRTDLFCKFCNKSCHNLNSLKYKVHNIWELYDN